VIKVYLYVKENAILTIVVLYFSFSVLLNIIFGFDYLIPCLWKTFFGIECSGCGVTSSIIEIFKGNFLLAWEMNKITFLVFPLLFLYSIKEIFFKIYKV
jgi:hypothetical protein|tara:strand:- start:10 stop:306 length:297 start_codon:yes stop_codon:yes gene_type:complete